MLTLQRCFNNKAIMMRSPLNITYILVKYLNKSYVSVQIKNSLGWAEIKVSEARKIGSQFLKTAGKQ